MRVYYNFEEFEKSISENTPPIIYKYRDWGIELHKTIITKRELYFAQPHTLNDPYDSRPPYNFVVTDFDIETARFKIREAGRALEPDLTVEQLENEVEKRIQAITKNPIEHFKRNRMDYVLNSIKYDNIGILSFSSEYDNEPMWAHYGNNSKGFAIGLNTLRLAKALNCAVGMVDYNDSPLDYYIFGDNTSSYEKEFFRKSTKWQTEKELRFLLAGIGLYRKRVNIFPKDAVEEIVFGLNTNEKTQEEIIKASNLSIQNISFYKLALKSDSFGFEKVKLV